MAADEFWKSIEENLLKIINTNNENSRHFHPIRVHILQLYTELYDMHEKAKAEKDCNRHLDRIQKFSALVDEFNGLLNCPNC